MQNQQHPAQQAALYGSGQGQAGTLLRERDLFVELLTLLKHASRMYTTAVTEAGCPVFLQTMQRLLHETLAEQGDCFQVMNRRGWYPAGPSPTRQDIQKAIQNAHQTIQDMRTLLQWVGLPNGALQQGRLEPQQGNWQAAAPYGQPVPGQGAVAQGGYVQATGWQPGAYAGASGAYGQAAHGRPMGQGRAWQTDAPFVSSSVGSWQDGAAQGASTAAQAPNPPLDGRGAFTGTGMHAGVEAASSTAAHARGAHRETRNWKRSDRDEYS